MVDIHSHILAGLDDGARTIEDSLAMVDLAAAHGTTDIVATPHANSEFKFDPEAIERRLAELRAAAGGKIRIHSGCDFHLMYDNIEDALANPAKYTINHGQYLLIEFSDLIIFQNSGDIIQRLRERGMLSIVTHPERNMLLQQRIDTLEQWVREGSYLQITAHSLLGLFGRRAKEFSNTLIARGLAHFVASDAHDVERRTPRLDEAFEALSKQYGAGLAERLCIVNPRAVIEGRPVESGVEIPMRPRKWYRFWG
jgi:protein-tyrosine phosphatase